MMPTTRVLVVDNAAATRNRLCALLSELPEVEADGCVASERAVSDRIETRQPNIVVIDVPMHEPGGFDLVVRMREHVPHALIIILSNHVTDEFRTRGLTAGADHFLAKSAEFERVLELVCSQGHAAIEVPKAKVLLLVEDDPDDATLVTAALNGAAPERFQVLHASRLGEALERLRQGPPVDVILLDLRLPDASGIDTLRTVSALAGETPVVVLTGADNEQLGRQCMDAGAQDYLSKNQLRPHDLQRAVGYALIRVREAQLRDLQHTLLRFRALSSATQTSLVTATLARSGAIRARAPELFADIVAQYLSVIQPVIRDVPGTLPPTRRQKEQVVAALGDAGGGPRDLLDTHLAALELATPANSGSHPPSRTVLFEARLLALEMMGLLVDYYRIGNRRDIGGDFA